MAIKLLWKYQSLSPSLSLTYIHVCTRTHFIVESHLPSHALLMSSNYCINTFSPFVLVQWQSNGMSWSEMSSLWGSSQHAPSWHKGLLPICHQLILNETNINASSDFFGGWRVIKPLFRYRTIYNSSLPLTISNHWQSFFFFLFFPYCQWTASNSVIKLVKRNLN